jgi:uncharacterized protein (TIGR00290 family)
MEKIVVSWSGGKDSALALYELRKSGNFDVTALITTVTEDYGRISMHGVRRSLLESQAEACGIPLRVILISKTSSNEEYETRMRLALESYRERGVTSVAFGDIFLDDLRMYREGNLARVGMKGLFPLWKRDTREMAGTFIDLGFKAITTCLDSKALQATFVGRQFDREFLSELPEAIDPCGENGEFHSFTYAGPIFQGEIAFEKGEIVLRDDRFYFCDLVPRREEQGGDSTSLSIGMVGNDE